jgi:hypothetical protein
MIIGVVTPSYLRARLLKRYAFTTQVRVFYPDRFTPNDLHRITCQ